MNNINSWNDCPKHDMSELDILREENKLLKENLEEMQRRNIIDNKCQLNTLRNPLFPGALSAYIVAIVAIISFYSLQQLFSDQGVIERFIMWLLTFVICYVVFALAYLLFDKFILEKIDKISNRGFYKKDNERRLKTYIPHILFFIILFILTMVGPQ